MKNCPIKEYKPSNCLNCEKCEYSEDCKVSPDKMRAIAILMDVGSRYGYYKYENGKYIIHTYGDARMIYETPEEGCWDWLDYMNLVNDDNPGCWDEKDINFILHLPRTDASIARKLFKKITSRYGSHYFHDSQGRFIVVPKIAVYPVYPSDPKWPGDTFLTAKQGCIAFLPFMKYFGGWRSDEIAFVERLAKENKK